MRLCKCSSKVRALSWQLSGSKLVCCNDAHKCARVPPDIMEGTDLRNTFAMSTLIIAMVAVREASPPQRYVQLLRSLRTDICPPCCATTRASSRNHNRSRNCSDRKQSVWIVDCFIDGIRASAVPGMLANGQLLLACRPESSSNFQVLPRSPAEQCTSQCGWPRHASATSTIGSLSA